VQFYPDNVSTDRISWRARSGDAVGTLPDVVGNIDRYVAYGDGLAALFIPLDGSFYRMALAPVDLTTGQLGPNIASKVMDARPLGDRRIALMLGDSAAGRVAVANADAPSLHTVTELPPNAVSMGAVSLSGGRIAAVRAGTGGSGEPSPAWITDLGSGVWTRQMTSGHDPLGHVFDGFHAPTLAGGVVMTALSKKTSSSQTFRLSWPGGSRDLATGVSGAVLGHGGQVVVRHTPGPQGTWEAQDARTGKVLTMPPSVPLAFPIVDGTWVWQGADAEGRLVGADVAGTAKRTVPTGLGCKPRLDDVRDRWALLICGPGDVYVQDLHGILPTWKLPVQADDQEFAIGAGFIAWARYPTELGSPELVVADLYGDHTEHRYGLLRGRTFPPGPQLAVDDAGGARLLYIDPESQVRVVDLAWLETTAPAASGLTGSARLIRGTGTSTPLAFGWSYTDAGSDSVAASGLSSYDVRYRQGKARGGPYGSWVSRSEWQATTASSISLGAAAGTDTCFEVRARDARGNLTAWSGSRCTYVDGAAPTLSTSAVGPRVIPAVSSSTVRFTYSAKDASGVASYDVAVREAGPGKAYGPWQSRSGWLGRTTTSVTATVTPGSDVCFRVRARDSVGNLGAWSTPDCVAVPHDDTSLLRASDTPAKNIARVADARALRGTVTVLGAAGATIQRADLTGRQIALSVIRGPGQGAVDVYVGKRRLGRVKLAASSWHRAFVYVPADATTWRGTVSVTSVGGGKARIDAVAILR
jgi:hypothetical protein